jgi:hypothetical protein
MPEEAVFFPGDGEPAAPRADRPTAAGRLAVGTVAALGAYLAFRKFLAGWAALVMADPPGWWNSDEGLFAVLGAQALAAVFVATLAGAGRPGGWWLGLIVGALTGGLFLGGEVLGGAPPGYLVLAIQPAVLAVLGTAAGAVGGAVWAGRPEVDMPSPAVRRSSSVQLGEVTPKDEGRPTRWLRIVVGAVLITAGVGLADPARKAVEKNSGGALRSASIGQARFLSSQLATLAVLGGAAVAAASTGAGVRHGALAGVLGTAGVFGLAAVQQALPVPVLYLLDHMGVDATNPASPAVAGGVGFGLLVGGVVGGWLGGTLFLPLAPAHRRAKRMRYD